MNMIRDKEQEKNAQDKSIGKSQFRCQYCNKSMSKYDYETFHGLCGKCREIVDWKNILQTAKE
jgi:hypothetical protein